MARHSVGDDGGVVSGTATRDSPASPESLADGCVGEPGGGKSWMATRSFAA